MTIMKIVMIKTAQTPYQSLYKDMRILNKIAWHNQYSRNLNGNDVILILYEMLHICSVCILNADASLRILSTDASGCFLKNKTFPAGTEIGISAEFFQKLS